MSGSQQRILVTGAAGYLGRATVEILRLQGRCAIGVDVTDRGMPELRICDLTDHESVLRLFAEERPEAVLHYAAFGSSDAGLLKSAEDDTAMAVDVNLNGLVNVLRASEAMGVERLAWSSSTTAYGPPQLYPTGELLDEDAILAPCTSYGATKMLGEGISRGYFGRGKLRAVALRLPLIYGPGRWYGGAQKNLMAFIECVLAGAADSFTFSDEPTDWMYVEDAARAMIRLVDTAQVAHPVYNVVGHVDSPLDIAREVVRQVGSACTVERDPNGTASILINGNRFTREFGFHPVVDRVTGIRRYLEHLSARRGTF